MRQIEHIRAWRYWLLYPLAWLFYLWNRSLRFEVDAHSIAYLQDTSRPVIGLFWHNRLFCASELYRRYRKGRSLYGLISSSKDGAWLAAIFRVFGIGVVRGSNNHRGSTALRELLKKTDSGHDIAITPDGPRGPRYAFNRGALFIAEKSTVDLCFVSPNYSAYWQLKSWDGFRIPKPFSKVRLVCRRYKNLEALKAVYPDLHNDDARAQKILLDIGLT
ncbi:MAG: hypothetical protein A2Y14_03395 [Verrucomicrobia bacterium GWF2_51_19]|nr:MAG: hypothetical protein A2Y14_03395 [Verrucomicrobia bacterium GWF2_51_19]HCJ11495.1 hypothetical protein [Opitutae bacterium]